MEHKKKIKILKVMFAIIVICLCIGLTIYLIPVMKNLSTIEGQNAF